MKFILGLKKERRVRILNKGDVLDSLIIVAATCKVVAEKIAIEKKINNKEALKLVVDSILDSYDSLYSDPARQEPPRQRKKVECETR